MRPSAVCHHRTRHRNRTGGQSTTVFNAETLAALCARLHDHADGIVNVAAHEMETDIRQATRALALFATLKFRIAEIAEMALTQAGPAIARDLRQALDDAG
jgi:hypothetical protein